LTNRFREEEAIRRAQLGSGRRSFVHSQLLPQGQVLDRELAVAAEEERRSRSTWSKRWSSSEILSGSAPIDQRLAAGRGFGEGQREIGSHRRILTWSPSKPCSRSRWHWSSIRTLRGRHHHCLSILAGFSAAGTQGQYI